MIPIAKPLLGTAEAEAASRAILSGWVSQGPEVAAFEKEFASFVGAPHACAVSNCTVALHLALLAADVQPDDEVITVSHSFIATANAIRYCGATPVFVDVETDGYNLDASLVDKAITSRTRAILCVHQMGMPCDLAAIIESGRQHGVAVIEDAACAAGSEVLWNGNWEKIGRPHGDAACFSFHPRKVISTGEGGIVTTRHAAWREKLALLRQHCMSVPGTVRHSSPRVIFELYPSLGYNYRMTDIQAAIGRVQLTRLSGLVEARRALAERYTKQLRDIPGLVVPAETANVRSNWQSYCVRLPPWCDQREVMQNMLDDGVATRRGIMCAHRELAYECAQGLPLGRSEEAQDRSILLPIFSQMTLAEQDEVVRSLKNACVIRETRTPNFTAGA